MLLALALLTSAQAADTWVGGAISTVPGYQSDSFFMPTQAEADGRFATDLLYGRLDLDLHLDPTRSGNIVSTPVLPEWAMLQIGQEGLLGRVGITNPNMSLEDWDEWNNYLPTFSLFFNGASPGRVLGGEIAYRLDDGTEIYAYGGMDLDFSWPDLVPITGVGIATEQDAFSTWSGIALYPTENYHGLFSAVEFYPLDWMWVTLDGGLGLSGSSPYAGGQLVLNFLPEGTLSPVARVEAVFDPDNALGLADGSASVGLRAAPLDFLTLALEGKGTFIGDSVEPGVFLMVALHRPEPTPYSAVPDEE